MADDTDRNPTGGLRVGACQTPEILGDPDAALACIEDFARQGADHHVDLLLCPECFLQGYLVDPDRVRRHAMDLNSPKFAAVLQRLEPITPTVVVAVIETERGRYFNTCPVKPCSTRATAFPRSCWAPFGINICSDTQFPEPAAQVAVRR